MPGKNNTRMEEGKATKSTSAWNSEWAKEQRNLSEKLITWNEFSWRLPSEESHTGVPLKYVGGVDISFVPHNNEDAVASLVILQLPELKLVHEVCQPVKMKVPYVSGFLAFREVEFLVALIQPLLDNNSEFLPQVILVDGNGILHPRGFGLASHLGVLLGIPTIGVAKTLACVDGLTHTWTAQLCQDYLWEAGDAALLIGVSGKCHGAAMRGSNVHQDAIYYVSQGHKINLDTAIEVVRLCARTSKTKEKKRYLEPNDYLPLPIALADSTSRRLVQLLGINTSAHNSNRGRLLEEENENENEEGSSRQGRKRKRTPSPTRHK